MGRLENPKIKWRILAALIALTILLFVFYSRPLWNPTTLHRSVVETDRLHHQKVEDLFSGKQVDFTKYGIGAHFMDWLAVKAGFAFTEEAVSSIDFQRRSARLAAWYHCLLAALCAPVIWLLLSPYLKPQSALLASGVFGAMPAVSFWAITSGVNIPFVFFTLCALVTLDRWAKGRGVLYTFLCAMFSAVAFMYKEFFALFLIAFPYILWKEIQERKSKSSDQKKEVLTVVIFIVVFAGVFYLLSFEWYRSNIYFDHWDSYFTPALYDMGFWKPRSILIWLIPSIAIAFLKGIQTVSGAILAGRGLYSIAFRKRERILILVLPVFMYFLFVPVRFQVLYFPYLLPIAPFLAAAVAVGYEKWAGEKLKPVRIMALILAPLCLLSLFVQSALIHCDLENDTRIAVEGKVDTLAHNSNVTIATYTAYTHSAQPDCKGCSHHWVSNDGGDFLLLDVAPDYLILEREIMETLAEQPESKLEKAGMEQAVNKFAEGKGRYELFDVIENNRPFYERFYGLNQGYYLFERITQEDPQPSLEDPQAIATGP